MALHHRSTRLYALFVTLLVPAIAVAWQSGSSIAPEKIFEAIGVREGTTVCEMGAGDVGNGLADSFFLTTTIGGVHVFESSQCFDPFTPCETEIDYVGPMVGVGGEWRL